MLLITKRSEKVKKNLERFKNTKFNYENFISEYYIDDDGNAYISAKVSSIDDIISKYSIQNYEWANSEFINYVENVANYIPIEETIVLEICGHKFNEREQTLIKKVISQYFGLKLGDSIIDININKKKSFILLIFGLVSLALFVILNFTSTSTTFLELALLALWFFLWEYLDVRLLERSKLSVKKIEAAQLANLKIIFNENEK